MIQTLPLLLITLFRLPLRMWQMRQLLPTDASVFTKALENVAMMRGTNGGEANRLQFECQYRHPISKHGSGTRAYSRCGYCGGKYQLGQQQILVQASASMIVQANTAKQVADACSRKGKANDTIQNFQIKVPPMMQGNAACECMRHSNNKNQQPSRRI